LECRGRGARFGALLVWGVHKLADELSPSDGALGSHRQVENPLPAEGRNRSSPFRNGMTGAAIPRRRQGGSLDRNHDMKLQRMLGISGLIHPGRGPVLGWWVSRWVTAGTSPLSERAADRDRELRAADPAPRRRYFAKRNTRDER